MGAWVIFKRFALLFVFVTSVSACNDPDERKTHYVTIVRSQDVEIREEFVDTDMKKPTVVVHHPDGVDVRHLPTKPRKTVSFAPVSPASLITLVLTMLTIASWLLWRDEGLSMPKRPSIRLPQLRVEWL